MKPYFHKLIPAIALTGLFLSSCSDYLDIVPKGRDIFTKVEQYAELFNDAGNTHVYSNMSFVFLTDDYWTNPQTVNQIGTSLGADEFFYVDPQTSDRLRWYTTKSVAPYEFCYSRINKVCNIILDNIGDATGDEALRKQTIAEARAFRAYNYFILVNLFARHYNPETASTDICVPLFEHYGLEQRPAQATVAQLYKFIEDDLNAAIPDLSDNPANCLHFSKAAGYALRAKMHLFKKDFDKALSDAQESYKLNNFVYDFKTLSTATGIIKINQNPENLYFGSTGSISTFDFDAISPDLASLFGATDTTAQVKDTRFSQFLSYATTKTGDASLPSQSGKLDAEYAPGYDTKLNGAKYFCYNGAGLRTTDVILMMAECYARKSDFSNMRKFLDEVRSKRIIGYTPETENPSDWVEAVNIVINERRKEFIGGFNRFWDLRRLNTEPEFSRTLTRVFPANPDPSCGFPQKTYTLPADSWLWVIPLPIDEFANYPGLTYNVPY